MEGRAEDADADGKLHGEGGARRSEAEPSGMHAPGLDMARILNLHPPREIFVPIQAYSYIRWSSKRQTGNDSLRRQLELAENYAAKHGLVLDTDARDEGVSSYHGKHRFNGALGAFLGKVQTGDIPRGSYLLVEHFDRLTRETVTTALSTFLSLINAGIVIVTLTDERAYSLKSLNENWTDFVITLGAMARAHEENKTKGGRVAKNHRNQKQISRATLRAWTPRGPTWAKLDPSTGRFVPIPQRMALIQRLFDGYEAGRGLADMARMLNEVGESGPKKGHKWTRESIKDILVSRRVLGEYQPMTVDDEAGDGSRIPDGPPIPSFYPAPISDEQFLRVQAIITANKRQMGRKNGGDTFNNIFIGLGHCSECGGTFGAHSCSRGPVKRPVVLRCVRAAQGGCLNKRRVPYGEFEASFLKFVTDFELNEQTTKSPNAVYLDRAYLKRDDLDNRVRNLSAQLELRNDNRLRLRYDELVAELDAVESNIAMLENKRPVQRTETANELIERIPSLSGTELYSARARLSTAVRSMVDLIDFDLDGTIRVILVGGIKAYQFSGRCFERVEVVDLTPDLAVPFVRPGYRSEAFTMGDAAAIRRLQKLVA